MGLSSKQAEEKTVVLRHFKGKLSLKSQVKIKSFGISIYMGWSGHSQLIPHTLPICFPCFSNIGSSAGVLAPISPLHLETRLGMELLTFSVSLQPLLTTD